MSKQAEIDFEQRPRSRRAVLAGTVAGLAALTAQALGRPAPTQADGSHHVHLGGSNPATSQTSISRTDAGGSAFAGLGSGAGTGVQGYSGSGTGVEGTSGSGNGVDGASDSGTGVYGTSVNGFGVFAESTGNGWTSIAALKENAGTVISAQIVDPGSNSPAIEGYTVGTGAAIHGESARGRGGRFRGKKAQIKLDPSAATTHPASGAAGDIFLDRSKRLWLCKGGTSWVRIV